MSVHAVSLAEADRLESIVVPFIPPARGGSEIATLPLADVGPADMAFDGIVGRSALRDLIDQIKLVAPTESTDLRRDGQAGLRARCTSRRQALARVRQVQLRRSSCRLLESELFGHERVVHRPVALDRPLQARQPRHHLSRRRRSAARAAAEAARVPAGARVRVSAAAHTATARGRRGDESI